MIQKTLSIANCNCLRVFLRQGMALEGEAARPPSAGASALERMPYVLCGSCALEEHEVGARFCRDCGAKLLLMDVASISMRATRDECRHRQARQNEGRTPPSV